MVHNAFQSDAFQEGAFQQPPGVQPVPARRGGGKRHRRFYLAGVREEDKPRIAEPAAPSIPVEVPRTKKAVRMPTRAVKTGRVEGPVEAPPLMVRLRQRWDANARPPAPVVYDDPTPAELDEVLEILNLLEGATL